MDCRGDDVGCLLATPFLERAYVEKAQHKAIQGVVTVRYIEKVWRMVHHRHMDKSNPSPAPGVQLEKASRLNAAQKRQLKTRITELAASGENVTLPRLLHCAADMLALDITKGFAEKLLSEFGYRMSEDLEPRLGDDGRPDTARIWTLAPLARPLTPAEKAQALADRMKLLSGSFVEDLMEDPLLKFAGLEDIAVEATRSFSLALAAAVNARSRFGAKNILPTCADTAQLTLKGAIQR